MTTAVSNSNTHLPNFIIGGALKAGTTTLFHMVQQHPQVFMPTMKELRFFAYDPNDPWCQQNPHAFPIKTLAAYKEMFAGASGETAVGEASPNYLASDVAPHNIKATIPQAKLIFSVRNPVRSAYSAYMMSYRAGREAETVEVALTEEDRRVQRYRYYHYLQHWYALFPAEQIHVVLFDDLVERPLETAVSIYQFLDIDPSFRFDPTTIRKNRGGLPKNKIAGFAFKALNNFQKTALGKQLKETMPTIVRDLFGKAKRSNLKSPPPLPTSVERRLKTYYTPDIQQLERLIQRDLSHWLSN